MDPFDPLPPEDDELELDSPDPAPLDDDESEPDSSNPDPLDDDEPEPDSPEPDPLDDDESEPDPPEPVPPDDESVFPDPLPDDVFSVNFAIRFCSSRTLNRNSESLDTQFPSASYQPVNSYPVSGLAISFTKSPRIACLFPSTVPCPSTDVLTR